ncbi:hypothetical protein [Amycolatopsis pigmentata]|uniref:DUF5666 domain-containing protein n=1 Tax=Amycolatopsis pigmentata TaxID=450801 RepID=A0ABW5FTB4_9PSEU
MSTESTTTEQAPQAWGDPRPPSPKWSGRKIAVAAAVAVAIAASGAAVIYAGTSSNSAQQSTPAGGIGQGPFPGFAGGFAGDALHGEFTVSSDGGYLTERMQTGTVSASSANSVTVKSEDGYTQTYAIDSATEKQGNLTDGSAVTVIAKVPTGSGTATALSISDADAGPGGAGGFPRGGPPGFGG